MLLNLAPLASSCAMIGKSIRIAPMTVLRIGSMPFPNPGQFLHTSTTAKSLETDQVPLARSHLASFFAQYPKFEYDPSKPFMDEFRRLIVTEGFSQRGAGLRVARRGMKAAIVRQFKDIYGTHTCEIHVWHQFFSAIGIDETPQDIALCYKSFPDGTRADFEEWAHSVGLLTGIHKIDDPAYRHTPEVRELQGLLSDAKYVPQWVADQDSHMYQKFDVGQFYHPAMGLAREVVRLDYLKLGDDAILDEEVAQSLPHILAVPRSITLSAILAATWIPEDDQPGSVQASTTVDCASHFVGAKQSLETLKAGSDETSHDAADLEQLEIPDQNKVQNCNFDTAKGLKRRNKIVIYELGTYEMEDAVSMLAFYLFMRRTRDLVLQYREEIIAHCMECISLVRDAGRDLYSLEASKKRKRGNTNSLLERIMTFGPGPDDKCDLHDDQRDPIKHEMNRNRYDSEYKSQSSTLESIKLASTNKKDEATQEKSIGSGEKVNAFMTSLPVNDPGDSGESKDM
ncbi:hypothetical protein B0J17DRAFT_720623 [Rhizoctonia solani]|nr:hypothetical protein B0J17DRAFT_720623 [Rhizoctonia solani]